MLSSKFKTSWNFYFPPLHDTWKLNIFNIEYLFLMSFDTFRPLSLCYSYEIYTIYNPKFMFYYPNRNVLSRMVKKGKRAQSYFTGVVRFHSKYSNGWANRYIMILAGWHHHTHHVERETISLELWTLWNIFSSRLIWCYGHFNNSIIIILHNLKI